MQPITVEQTDFYPRPPRGGRPKLPQRLSLSPEFLSTPSARRATAPASVAMLPGCNFYPRPPRGGRPAGMLMVSVSLAFLSTPSARRATLQFLPAAQVVENFYPRPPRGGRPLCSQCTASAKNISIHALREEGDSAWYSLPSPTARFLSTPSARRATSRQRAGGILLVISIHALREEGDAFVIFVITPFGIFLSTPSARRATAGEEHGGIAVIIISIHALREEGDLLTSDRFPCPMKFLSTPSARRATPTGLSACKEWYYFYPRPPRGGRREIPWAEVLEIVFLSTPSARRATSKIRARYNLTDISIHALREEGDTFIQYQAGSMGVFLSTPSARRATKHFP